MKLQILVGAAALALIAGGASAATHKNSAGSYAAPSQPIAYSKLDTYLKASPRQKATGNWGLDSIATASVAPTGAAANTAASAPQAPMTPSAPAAADTSVAPSQAAPDTSAAPAAPSQPAPDAPATPPASPQT